MNVRPSMYRTLVVALGLFSLLPTLCVLTTLFQPQASFDADVDGTMHVDSVDPSARARGLRAGDRVDGVALTMADRFALLGPLFPRPGTRITLPIERGGSRRSFELIAVDRGSIGYARFYFWFALLGTLLWIFVGGVLVLRRPSAMTWGFYLFALGMHPVFNYWTFFGPLPVAAVCLFGLCALRALGHVGIVIFAARFPHGSTNAGRTIFDASAIALSLVLFSNYLSVVTPIVTGLPSAPHNAEPAFWLSSAAGAIALGARLFMVRGRDRTALAWILGGYVGTVAADYLFVGYALAGVPWLRWSLYSACVAGFPATVLFAVLQRRAFALGFVANRTLVYGFFAAALACAFLALDWWLSSAVAFSSVGFMAGLVAALISGILLQAQQVRIVRAIGRVFLPERYAAGVALDHIRDVVRNGTASSREAIADDVVQALGLRSLAVFGRTGDGGFVRQVSCGWPDDSLWHLLPEDRLCRTLVAATKAVRLSELDVAGVTLPAARPTLAISVRRHGLIERAILVGERWNGSTLDRDEVRGLSAVLSESVAR